MHLSQRQREAIKKFIKIQSLFALDDGKPFQARRSMTSIINGLMQLIADEERKEKREKDKKNTIKKITSIRDTLLRK